MDSLLRQDQPSQAILKKRSFAINIRSGWAKDPNNKHSDGFISQNQTRSLNESILRHFIAFLQEAKPFSQKPTASINTTQNSETSERRRHPHMGSFIYYPTSAPSRDNSQQRL